PIFVQARQPIAQDFLGRELANACERTADDHLVVRLHVESSNVVVRAGVGKRQVESAIGGQPANAPLGNAAEREKVSAQDDSIAAVELKSENAAVGSKSAKSGI